MDSLTDDPEVFSRVSGDNTDCIVVTPQWRVKEMTFTLTKLLWLWNEMNKYKTLFSDLTRGDIGTFQSVIDDPFTYWLEILDKDDNIIGVFYLTDMQRIVDFQVHLIIFDRKIHEKRELVAAILKEIVVRYPYVHRLSANIPEIYHATVRLTEKLGFKREGCKREFYLMGTKRVNELFFGILASEITNGSNSGSTE